MSIRLSALVLILLLLTPWSMGQDVDPEASKSETTQRMTPAEGGGAGSDMIHTVKRANSSRLAPAQDEDVTITLESELPLKATLPAIEFKSCQARVALSYQQRNTLARVDVEISHEECPASAGTVDILVRFYKANGELETLIFTEAWERDKGSGLEFTRDYGIGADASLSRVLARNVRCACSEAAVPAE